MDQHITKSAVPQVSFPDSGKFKKLLLHDASPHIPQEPTELSNLVFLDRILGAKGANLILSREGYRVDRH